MSFQHVPVTTVADALAAMKQHGEGGKVYAGGVALSILMKSRIYQPKALIDIARVKELSFIEGTPEGGLRIGAGTVHRLVETSPLVRPASDPPAALLVLDARMKARRVDGRERIIPAGEFWTGYYECALGPDELLTEIEIDPLPPGFRTACTRFTTRSKEDKPCISISAAVATEADGRTCRQVRVGLGGVEAIFRRLGAVEEGLAGKELTRQAIDGVLAGALGDLDPLTDIRASDSYRRQVTPVFIRRTIEKALGRAS
ncbi:MAG: FAD binding domain-containing protein [Candidatus Tectomicrobia bacterium]|nr:FAD binding domain-containing protein [Candidatus Tectomicrobia bacterium]